MLFCRLLHICSIVTEHFKICLFTYKLKISLHQLSTIPLTFSTVITNHPKLHNSTATKHFLATGAVTKQQTMQTCHNTKTSWLFFC
jgi:predicted metallopeptidase